MSARVRIARSRAEVTWSSAGSPLGLTKLVCAMPSRCAARFISAANAGTDPDTPSASTTAKSFADFTIIILSALSTVTLMPTLKPIFEGCCAMAFGETVRSLSGVTRPSLMACKVT